MLLSEMGKKEIINIHDGKKLGVVADIDIILDKEGNIKALLLLPAIGFKMFKVREHQELLIPWKLVRKVGDDILLVDINLKKM